MAANYRRLAGAASTASYRGWTGVAMFASKQLRLNWCGFGCKLGWFGDVAG
jgi:hypothetical protein